MQSRLIELEFSIFYSYCNSWNSFRSNQAIEKVVGDGLAWVDEQGETKTYWFPSLFPGRSIQQQQ